MLPSTLAPRRAVPKIGVQCVGEFHRGRAFGQGDHFALRREHINLVVEQFVPELLLQVALVGQVFLPLQYLAQPRDLLVEAGVRFRAFLVAPVRGDAEFGMLVHLAGAYLHLEREAARADHRGMQRAVVVALGVRDVVVEFAFDRRPQFMHQPERGIAAPDPIDQAVIDQDAHRANIVEFAEIHMLALHLVDDAVDVFGAAGHFGGDARLAQYLLQLRDHIGDILLAIHPALIQQLRDFLVQLRLQIAHRKVFQFPFELPYAKPVGQRRKEAAGLLRDLSLLFRLRARQMAQGLGALGELDQHHADVLHHRQQHLAQAFDLLRGFVLFPFFDLAGHLAELPDMFHARDALDQHLHVGAEFLLEFQCPVIQIVRHRMQNGGGDHFMVHIHASQNRCGTESVLHQRSPGQFRFPGVERLGQFAGMADQLGFCGRERSSTTLSSQDWVFSDDADDFAVGTMKYYCIDCDRDVSPASRSWQ